MRDKVKAGDLVKTRSGEIGVVLSPARNKWMAGETVNVLVRGRLMTILSKYLTPHNPGVKDESR